MLNVCRFKEIKDFVKTFVRKEKILKSDGVIINHKTWWKATMAFSLTMEVRMKVHVFLNKNAPRKK